MRRTKEDALETRNAILRVALDCFSRRGYTLTTFNDIAKRIHLTKGAVFWHFKTKEALLGAIMADEHKVYEPLKGIHDVQSLEDVRDVFLNWAHAITTHPMLKKFLIFAMSRVEWSEKLKKDLCKQLDAQLLTDPFEAFEQSMTRLQEAGLLRDGVSPRQVCTLMSACFFGILRENFLHEHEVDIDSTLRLGLEAIIESTRKKAQ